MYSLTSFSGLLRFLLEVYAIAILFHFFVLGQWFSPPVKGSRPPPCSSFSLTMNDKDQVVMFGGYSPSEYSSKACVLHLPTIVSHV